MSAPANLEFEFIETPPPDYNTIQIMHHLNTAPPPYDACVRASCGQQHKSRWSATIRDSTCIRVIAISVTASGLLMLLSGIILLALQQFLHTRYALLGWCLFGSACALLLLSAYLWRTIVSQSSVHCFCCCVAEEVDSSAVSSASTFSSNASSASSPASRNVANHDYAHPPDETSGPPPYHASALVRQTLETRSVTRTERPPRIPIVTFSNRVQPVPVHLADTRIITGQSLAQTESGPVCRATVVRSVSASAPAPAPAPRVPVSTPLTVITSFSPHRPALARLPRFAVNQGYVIDETLGASHPTRVHVESAEGYVV